VFSLSDKKVVVIDAGHYSNRYNVGISGLYYESEGMLKLSKLIQAKLNTTGKVDCYLTREDEKDISLYQRGKIASDKGAFVFISEHTNAFGNPDVKGTNVFYSVDLPNDKAWADKLSQKVSNALETTNRGASVRESEVYKGEDYYGVIDSAQDNGVPHVFLIENAFHSNINDEAKLRSDIYLNKIADAQCVVICELCGFTYSPVSKKYYVVTNYIPQGTYGIELNALFDKYFTGLDITRWYARSNANGIWIETQYISMENAKILADRLNADGLLYRTVEE
jgi:N-acetylmuramoyl-L-alanine amidase